MRRRGAWSTALITLLAAQAAHADDETDEAVIRGSRSRPGETWIGHAEMERTGGVSVADALRPQPDVDLQGGGAAGSVGRFTLRGSSPEESLVVVDGLRMSSRAAGAVVGGTDPNNLPVAMIQRMSVARGPMSAVYGPNAVSGVLQITTREAVEPWSLAGTLQGASALTAVTPSDDVEAIGFSPFFAGRGQLSAAVREGPRFVVAALTASATRGWVPNTQAHFLGGALKVGRVIPGGVAYAWVDAFDGRTGSPAFDSLFDSDSFDADDLQLRRGVRAAGVMRRALGPRDQLEVSLGLLTQRTTLLNPMGTDLTAGVEAAVATQNISELQVHALYTRDTRGLLGALSIGVDAGREGFSSGDDAQAAYRVAPMARARRSFGSATVDLAARVDVDSLYGAQVSPRGAVELSLGRAVQVFAAVGRGFRPPTFSELAWPTVAYPMASSGPTGERGNADLRVESAWGGDVAVVVQPPGARWEASARWFGTRTTDMIRWMVGDDGYWSPHNVDVAWSTGGTLEGRVRLGAHLVAQASGFYQRTVDVDGQELTGRLRSKVTGRLTWFDRGGWRAWAEALWFDRAGNDATGAPWQGVFVNARVGRQIGRAAGVFVLGENLLDTRFESARRLPTPGRTLWVGVTLDLDED